MSGAADHGGAIVAHAYTSLRRLARVTDDPGVGMLAVARALPDQNRVGI